ncbi:unnamed protein product [Rotaria socialis]
MTVQLFIEQFIRSKSRLNDSILRWTDFSAVQLRYIIDFYEMFEEIAFDQVLRVYIKKELAGEAFNQEERKRIIDAFCRATFEKEKITEKLKSIDIWIAILKRLIVRILNANISLDVPLQIYLERTDLWNNGINYEDLAMFEVEDIILLQHTYVILTGLENKKKAANQSQPPEIKSKVQTGEGLRKKVNTWYTQTATATTSTKEIRGKKTSGNKGHS